MPKNSEKIKIVSPDEIKDGVEIFNIKEKDVKQKDGSLRFGVKLSGDNINYANN